MHWALLMCVCVCVSDGKLYQEKVQSIMYLRHSNSGGKSASSSVVSLSPTVFTDTPHDGTVAFNYITLTLKGFLYQTQWR